MFASLKNLLGSIGGDPNFPYNVDTSSVSSSSAGGATGGAAGSAGGVAISGCGWLLYNGTSKVSWLAALGPAASASLVLLLNLCRSMRGLGGQRAVAAMGFVLLALGSPYVVWLC